MLTDPRSRIIRFFPDCFSDLIKYYSGFIISYKVTIQAFTNTSINNLMSLEHLLEHQKMQLNAKP